jgi:hypothetical protein
MCAAITLFLACFSGETELHRDVAVLDWQGKILNKLLGPERPIVDWC